MKKFIVILLLMLINSKVFAEKVNLICVKDDRNESGFSNSYTIDTQKNEILIERSGITKKFRENNNLIIYNSIGESHEFIVELDRYTGKKKVFWRPIDSKKAKKMGLKINEYNIWTETCIVNPKKMF